MATRRLKYNGRKKAAFGAEAAAILAAAGINAATQLTAAGINSKATNDAAKSQAQALNASAQRQAQAIKDQTERSKEYQIESQDFIREQNAENRELQKDIQMQLQMLTGQQNVNDRLEASKIKVRNGGCTKRKLRKGGNATFSLRGSNMPFIVTDGGGVVAIGTTPEGYDLYELYGNDHKHYHKANGGKAKTGVGIRFADGSVVEGEGNQNTNRGEKMLVTPDNAYFISKHTIKGFNPAEAVDNGMNPVDAYTIQENIKAANGISDDGNNSSPVKKMAGGDFVTAMYNVNGPQIGVDTLGDTVVGVTSNVVRDKRRLRCGGKGRRKAENGLPLTNYWRDYYIPIPFKAEALNSSLSNIKAINPPNTNSTNTVNTRGNNFRNSADLWGAGIGALGNIGGALITSIGNRRAARRLADAYSNSANILSDAYRSLQTIDTDTIRREDYSAAHALPAIQAPVSMAAQPLAEVDRQLQRRLGNAERYSASSAAAQRRMNEAEVDVQDMRNKIYSADQEQMQRIRQGNAERVTQAALANAQLDTEANRQYSDAMLNLREYNNDIVNQRILGSAGALSEGTVNAAGALANATTANSQAWANALVGSSQGFANTLSAMADRRNKLAAALLGADSDSQASYYAILSSDAEAKSEYNHLLSQYYATSDADARKRLARQINNIASHRGFNFI